MNDLIVRNHGSIFILVAVTPAGEEWIGDHIPEDAMRFGGGIVVEHRFISNIVNGAVEDGLTVGD